jgi:hypothetical protein
MGAGTIGLESAVSARIEAAGAARCRRGVSSATLLGASLIGGDHHLGGWRPAYVKGDDFDG